MPAPLKLALALALLIAILVLVLGVYMNVLAVQLSCFVALSLLLLILRGVKSWLSGYRMMLPFLISLVLVYVLFGILKIRTQEGEPGSVIHWLDFGLKRIMLFAN
ncbi:MAG: hypothetical protein WCR92_08400, partial [Candidatus Cloacimonadaceae bacterium]